MDLRNFKKISFQPRTNRIYLLFFLFSLCAFSQEVNAQIQIGGEVEKIDDGYQE